MSPTAEQLAHAAAWAREAGISGCALTATEHACERIASAASIETAKEIQPVGIERGLPAEKDVDSSTDPNKRQPTLDSSTKEPCSPWEPQLLAILKQRLGPEAAVTSHELAAMLQVPERIVRARISHLRAVDGAPICSSAGGEARGYFWPRRLEDALPTLNQLASRQREIGAAVDGMRDGLQREFGSLDLFGRNAA